jgi:hypothetical protein
MRVDRMETSERVVQAVAAARTTDPLELPPLYDAIDPDALGAVVDRMDEGEVVFTYAATEVTVTADGSVAVEEQELGCRDAEAASVTD